MARRKPADGQAPLPFRRPTSPEKIAAAKRRPPRILGCDRGWNEAAWTHLWYEWINIINGGFRVECSNASSADKDDPRAVGGSRSDT
jgi:hypothetical protein